MATETERGILSQQQDLQRLLRQSSQTDREAFLVGSTGGKTTAWPAKVLSKYDYNVYNVQSLKIVQTGLGPVELGPQMRAYNMAESFIDQGQLYAGTYVIVFQLGDVNIFCVEP